MLIFFAVFAFILFPLLIFVFHKCTRKYLNPYKLIFIFGKKGSGKSTLLAKYAFQYKKLGYNVYSTEFIPGTYKIEYSDIGYSHIPPNSCIIIDEVGMIWDKRNFKNFPPEVRDYFKLQRHYRHVVIMASQTFDVDAKIRDLADLMYLVDKKLRVFSYAKRILRKTVLIESTAEAPAKIAENLEFDNLLFFFNGSRKLTFIPKYTKYFDSFATPALKEKTYEYQPLQVHIKDDKITLKIRRLGRRIPVLRLIRRIRAERR